MKMGEREEWVCERERERDVVEEEREKTWLVRADNPAEECPNVDGIVREFHSSSTLLHSHSIRHVVVRGRGCISKRFQSNYLFNYHGYANIRFFFFFPLREANVGRFMSRVTHCTFDICPPLLLFDISRSLLDVYRVDNSPLFPRIYIPIG